MVGEVDVSQYLLTDVGGINLAKFFDSYTSAVTMLGLLVDQRDTLQDRLETFPDIDGKKMVEINNQQKHLIDSLKADLKEIDSKYSRAVALISDNKIPGLDKAEGAD